MTTAVYISGGRVLNLGGAMLTVGGQVATPTTSPAPGTYGTTQTVSLACSTPSSSIYYTTDGSTPTFPITGTTTLYTAAITVSASALIQALATASGLTKSDVGMFNYSITTSAATPTFSPAQGSYLSTQTVTISCTTAGSSIYYTTDGSTPTYLATGTTLLYTGALTVSTSTLVQALAEATGFSNSSVGMAQYTIGASSFDYYIAPNGDDNNVGSLASPWSITALTNNQSTYGGLGKRIGIIGDIAGTQTHLQQGMKGGIVTTLYTLLMGQNTGNQNAALRVDGGTSGNGSTYLGSCDSSGVYKVGWAIFDGAQPGTGTIPVGPNSVILGQPWYMVTPVPHPGYVTLDGLSFTNFNYAGVVLGDVGVVNLFNLVVQNCKFYNAVCSDADENCSMLFLGTPVDAQVTNCLFNNGQSTGGTNNPWGMAGIGSYNKTTIGSGTVVTNCTFIGVGYSIRMKDTSQWGTFSYNYMDCGLFGTGAFTSASGQNQNPIKGCTPSAGNALVVHHNIIIGGGYWGWGEDGGPFNGSANFYNNTFYTPPAINVRTLGAWFKSGSGAGPITFHSNIVYYNTYYNNQGGPYATFSFQNGTGISATSLNFNYYGTGMTFGTNNDVTLSGWQALGYESNSIGGGTPFSGTPASGVPTSFAITGPATTAGVSGGPCGALDGTGSVGSTLT